MGALLSALEAPGMNDSAVDAGLLEKARRWLDASPHELRKAKSRLARVNVVRPLCQRPVRVEPSDVIDALLRMGVLIATSGGLISPTCGIELSRLQPLLFNLSSALSRDALTALTSRIRTDCPLIRIRQNCFGLSAATLRVECPRQFSAAVSRTVLSTLDGAVRRSTDTQSTLMPRIICRLDATP